MEVALGLCGRRYAVAEMGVLLADTSTVNTLDKVSLKSTIIFQHTLSFFSPGFCHPASCWLLIGC